MLLVCSRGTQLTHGTSEIECTLRMNQHTHAEHTRTQSQPNTTHDTHPQTHTRTHAHTRTHSRTHIAACTYNLRAQEAQPHGAQFVLLLLFFPLLYLCWTIAVPMLYCAWLLYCWCTAAVRLPYVCYTVTYCRTMCALPYFCTLVSAHSRA
jgi:hypothetical protein